MGINERIVKHISRLLLILLMSCNSENQKSDSDFDFHMDSLNRLTIKRQKNDTIVSIVTYTSDTQRKNGPSYYYQEGNLSKIEYYDNGNLAGAQVEFHKGSPALFLCHDSYGDTVFLRKYNGRNIEFETGTLLPHGTLLLDSLRNGGFVEYVGFIVKPPYTGIDIKIYLIDVYALDTIEYFKSSLDYNWIHHYYFKLKNKGTYKYVRTVKIIDSLRSLTKVITAKDTGFFTY